MWKQTVMRSAIGAAAVLFGLSAPAAAQHLVYENGYYGPYGYDGYYGEPYGYYGGPVEEGLGVVGDVAAGVGEVVGGTVGTVGSAFAGPYPGGGAVGYCESRFRSYDPASGTYLGYDGLRHPCP